MPLLEKVNDLKDLKKLEIDDLPELCAEIRTFLVDTVQKTGGHLGASLGAVELTVALHYLLDSPKDKLIWDVSHQAYAHKILTGRKNRMPTLRQKDGLSGFTDPKESKHDFFKTGHASTAIAQAMGLAVARDLKGTDEKIVAIVGDGALTGGLAYEALNNAGHTKRNILIILNDNEMSISPNVGAMSTCFNTMITNPLYNRVRKRVEHATDKFPRLQRLIKNAEEGFKSLIVPGILFEELGFRYFGPIDGHDIQNLVRNLKKITGLKGPRIVHLITKKGKGCDLADEDPERLHGIAPETKESSKVEVKTNGKNVLRSYTQIFAEKLVKLAQENSDIVAITAAMPSGTGLDKFKEKFPGRFFDVGIAEEYAVTFAGALAKGGKKPVCALYSTFLQRGIDQIIHDVALQEQNVLFAIDRAGVVGEDGPTHHGLFDIALMRSIPDAVLASPKDSFEMERMIKLGFDWKGVFAIRYPRGMIPEEFPGSSKTFEIGEGEVLKEGGDVTILTLGALVSTALLTAKLLERDGVRAGVINMRFAKPLDKGLLELAAQKSPLLVTMEDHSLPNGFGTACLEELSRLGLEKNKVIRLGFSDEFVPHAKRNELLESAYLTPDKAAAQILKEGQLCKK